MTLDQAYAMVELKGKEYTITYITKWYAHLAEMVVYGPLAFDKRAITMLSELSILEMEIDAID